MRIGGEGLCLRRLQRVVEEDLVNDEGQIVFGAESFELGSFIRFDEVAGWVIGMNQCDGARARRNALADGFDIEVPAVVVKERVGREFHVIERGEEIEERIAGLRDEYLVAGV